ncbi:inosine-5'-monophosphate dehydrogenase [Saccharophagus degradans 2-40]|uniref:Inosine-5'-monophosphate dehydrogenase n=2 Tax=Saccharophagus degradans TaxID=86304 RepID=Q21KQ8_SACD2|nr:inosine-5'-monophosphate dehydrogenase [Saccharophagus degradans 2-40]
MPRMKFPAHLLVALALSRVFVHLGRLFVFTKDGANAYNCSFISQALAYLKTPLQALLMTLEVVTPMLRIAQEALTFDDVLLVPGYSNVTAKDVDLKTRLTREITLNIPLLSAAMDTVTEARLAIALAQEGGIGIIHKSMTIEKQAEQVRAVKKFEAGVVKNPITIDSSCSIKDLIALTRQHNISGVPVLDNGDLVGIVTGRDVRFETNLDATVASIMTPKEKLVTVLEGTAADEVRALLHKHRIEKVLVVNDKFKLCGLITVKDINKAETYPNACKDADGSLRVGASVGTSPDTDDRVAALVAAGVDVLVVDTAHGHSQNVLNRVTKIKKDHPQVQVIGGNIATADAAKALVEAGADGVKVGIGPGSICTTRIVTGVGVPQISAIANVVDALKDTGVPVIADGGVRFSGDVAKAIVAGADCVMMGSMFAGTEEAPGEVELYQGRTYKSYRGMGSLGAMAKTQGSSDRYFQDSSQGMEKLVPEGIEGRVPYKGPLNAIVHQLMGGLRAAMGYTGSVTMEEMRTKPQFVRVTSAGMGESHVHDVSITKEAPNYPVSGR